MGCIIVLSLKWVLSRIFKDFYLSSQLDNIYFRLIELKYLCRSVISVSIGAILLGHRHASTIGQMDVIFSSAMLPVTCWGSWPAGALVRFSRVVVKYSVRTWVSPMSSKRHFHINNYSCLLRFSFNEGSLFISHSILALGVLGILDVFAGSPTIRSPVT